MASYSLLCMDCAEDVDFETERKGYFKNPPGRRISRECERCETSLGEMYGPVGVSKP